MLDSGRDSVNGLDLPFCRDFDSTEASTGKQKRLARVKSVMGKAKKKHIKESNIKRREKASRERIKIGTLPPPLLFGFSPFSPFLIGWRPCRQDCCVVLYQMVEGGGGRGECV